MQPPLWAERRDDRILQGIKRLKREEIVPGVSNFGNVSYPYAKSRDDLSDSVQNRQMIVGITPQIYKYGNPSLDTGFKKVKPLNPYADDAYIVWGVMIGRVMNTIEALAGHEKGKNPNKLKAVEFRIYSPGYRFDVRSFLKTTAMRWKG